MVGRPTASQIASASAASCLLRLMYAVHVLRRHQPHVVAKRAQLASPVVGRRTCFQPNHTAWNAAEEGQHLPAPQSLSQNRRTLCINPVNLKNVLG
jgi:hypothetical protein